MTDEQRMRDEFKKWLVERGLTDEVWLQDPYTSWSIDDMYDVYRARDAEVQELREALTEVTEDLASELIAKYGPIQAHPDTVRRFDRDMELVYRARKLLAGGEEGEAE